MPPLSAAAVLSVIKSYHCGLGGDVFALYYSARLKNYTVLTGRENLRVCSSANSTKMEIPTRGALAANVPGAVDAWVQLANRFATRPLKELWEPAIDYAANGFPVFPHLARVIKSFGERGHTDPAWAKIFFPQGKPVQVNELLVQNDLARTMSEISCDGRDAFYAGRVAESICRTFEEKGGCFSLGDFREHQSVWETPIHGVYRGYDVYVPPPNSYGLLLLLQLAFWKDTMPRL